MSQCFPCFTSISLSRALLTVRMTTYRLRAARLHSGPSPDSHNLPLLFADVNSQVWLADGNVSATRISDYDVVNFSSDMYLLFYTKA